MPGSGPEWLGISINAMSWLDAELARLLDPAYAQGMDAKTLDALHEMRSECQHVEVAISYVRRLTQGRLDVAGAYLRGAADQSGDPAGDPGEGIHRLVEELPRIIAGPPRPAGAGHMPGPFVPDTDSGELTAEVDEAFGAATIAELPAMEDAELRGIVAKLSEIEGRLSRQRHQMHELIDRVQAEIVERYRSGRATVDGLLG